MAVGDFYHLRAGTVLPNDRKFVLLRSHNGPVINGVSYPTNRPNTVGTIVVPPNTTFTAQFFVREIEVGTPGEAGFLSSFPMRPGQSYTVPADGPPQVLVGGGPKWLGMLWWPGELFYVDDDGRNRIYTFLDLPTPLTSL